MKLTFESSDDAVLRQLRAKANETVDLTYKRLKDRIDELGVTQPNVSLDAARDLIVVELPGVDNPQRARNMLQATAKLEFWDVYRVSDPGIMPAFMSADEKVKRLISGDTTKIVKVDSVWQYKRDTTGRIIDSTRVAKANKVGNQYELYAIKKSKGREEAPLEGDRVTDASANPDPQSGAVAISLKMDNKGAKTWGEMTTKAAQDNNREIAIVLDDKVVSAPRVINPITSGDSQITGDYTLQDGEDLAKILQIGKLPAKTRIVQESVVGPSLGQENINKSLLSLLLGLVAIIGVMIMYYSTGGVVSVIALLINIFLIIGVLTSLGTVLTLPGIAGIVLTMAAAVDANVIIYERVREELDEGKTVAQAINDGFKNSYPAIIDANISNLLIALVMYYFGLGPIKGFAIVLIIGILCTLFTAVLVAHLILDWMVNRGMTPKFSTPMSAHAFKGINIDWVGMRKKAYMFSAAIILA
ncbi:unnamed protein product, partial [Darwinula stevensoni]